MMQTGSRNWSAFLSERRLVAMERDRLLQLLQPYLKPNLSTVELENVSQLLHEFTDSWIQQLADWLQKLVATEFTCASIPLALRQSNDLAEPVIAVLIHTAHNTLHNRSHHEDLDDLTNVLDAYFSFRGLLIPLSSHEWVLLIPVRILTPKGKPLLQIELQQVITGLYSMLESEWLGGVRLTVSDEFIPYDFLASTYQQLFLTMQVATLFSPHHHIHYADQHYLEVWLLRCSEKQRQQLPGVQSPTLRNLDVEIELTLFSFFRNGCSLSETAKALHIHRNTLVYRLDKFKQESGYDVRLFDQAILVKIALMALKITNGLAK